MEQSLHNRMHCEMFLEYPQTTAEGNTSSHMLQSEDPVKVLEL